LDDFPEQDPLSYDHYGSVHLCFLTQITTQLMERLCTSNKLANKVRTFVEINLDFKVWQDNVFKITTKTKQLSNLLSPSASLVETLSQKLFTICSVMAEKPYIQYQTDSQLCEDVALSLYKKIENLYNYSNLGVVKKKG
jgi:hypothetical protein